MSKPEKKSATSQAPAVDKALDVLEFLANQPEGAAMKEITAALDRSMSEIYRMVLALEYRRFVHKDTESERYYLSLRLFELAHRYPPTARLVRAAQPIMEDLAAQSMQSCHLGVADNDRLVILASTDSPMPMHYGVKIGASFPLLETSSGVILSAFTRPERQETILREVRDEERQAFENRFRKIRGSGQETRRSDVVDGVTNISCAVRDHSGRAVAALTVPYLKQTRALPSKEDVRALTGKAAVDLSAALGYPSEEV